MTTRQLLLASALLASCANCGDESSPADLGVDAGADAGTDMSGEPVELAFSVDPTTVMVVEGGRSSTFSVSLNRAPEGDVAVSWAPEKLTLTPSNTVFTTDDFGPKIITVSAPDNDLLDDSSTETLTATVVGADVPVDDVVVTIVDDDVPMIAVNPEGLTLTEGVPGAVGVVIGAEPTGDVTIPITADDPDIVVEPSELVFSVDNPGVTRTVSVFSPDDDISEGDISTLVRFGPATGGGYDGVEALVSVFSGDDDPAGIVVDPTALTTTDNGGSASFDVRLASEPLASVQVTFRGDPTEGAFSPSVVIFEPQNWSEQQTITVTGTDDQNCAEGDVTYPITSSARSDDETYDGLAAPDVTVINIKGSDCFVGITPMVLDIAEGESGTFTVAPGGTIGADAVLNLTSTDAAVSLSASSLTFTPLDSSPQDVVVSVADDDSCAANQLYAVDVELEPGMHGLAFGAASVAVVAANDDVCGVDVSPTVGLATTEAGGSDTFDVVLTAQPTADVVVSFVSSDTTEGVVSPTSAAFTPANWALPQTITVSGVDDLCCSDGNVLYRIETSVTSADPDFDRLDPDDPFVTNHDDDSCGFVVLPDPSGIPQRTNESGTSATFTVALVTPIVCDDPQTGPDVTIPVFVTDPTEGVVAPSSLVFTSLNWNTPQTVTVTGVDDNEQDGPVQYNVILDTTISAEPGWNHLDPPNVPIINEDND